MQITLLSRKKFNVRCDVTIVNQRSHKKYITYLCVCVSSKEFFVSRVSCGKKIMCDDRYTQNIFSNYNFCATYYFYKRQIPCNILFCTIGPIFSSTVFQQVLCYISNGSSDISFHAVREFFLFSLRFIVVFIERWPNFVNGY